MSALPRIASLAILALGIPALAQEPVEFHRGNGMVWTIANINTYHNHKASFDLLIRDMGRALAPLQTWFGTSAPTPFYFHVGSDGCGTGTDRSPPGSKGRMLRVGEGCLIENGTTETQTWFRQSLLYGVGWQIFAPVSSGWPDIGFWQPMSRLMQTELVRAAEGAAAADRLLADDQNEGVRRNVNYYRSLVQTYGWAHFQKLLGRLKEDKLDLGRIETEASPMRLNYLLAYQSLGQGLKMGNRARDAGMTGVTNATVMKILKARNLLVIADRKGSSSAEAWEAYRTGKPDQAISLLRAP